MTAQSQREAVPVFGTPTRLPRGPHRITREQVAASQRSRLLAAIAQVVAEQGYAAAGIGDIVSRAGVSRSSFYEHFRDKEDCYLQGYETFVGVLEERIAEHLHETPDWCVFVVNALTAYLETLDHEPAVARAFLVEIDSAGPNARRRRREAHRGFAELIKYGHALVRSQEPNLGIWPDRLYLAVVRAISSTVADEIESDPGALMGLRDDLIRLIVFTVEGARDLRA